MNSIKAKDLKVGMDVAGRGEVVEVSPAENGFVGVTFAVLDYDCGEIEHFPCSLPVDEVLND